MLAVHSDSRTFWLWRGTIPRPLYRHISKPLLPHVPYSGKLSKEKNFANFAVLWLFAKVFSTKFRGMASFGMAKVSNLWKFSRPKSYFSLISESFLPRNFPAIHVFILYSLCYTCVFVYTASATDHPAGTIASDVCTSTEGHSAIRKSHAVTTSDIRQAETELCSAVSKLTLSDSTKLNSNAVSSSAENEEKKQGSWQLFIFISNSVSLLVWVYIVFNVMIKNATPLSSKPSTCVHCQVPLKLVLHQLLKSKSCFSENGIKK